MTAGVQPVVFQNQADNRLNTCMHAYVRILTLKHRHSFDYCKNSTNYSNSSGF